MCFCISIHPPIAFACNITCTNHGSTLSLLFGPRGCVKLWNPSNANPSKHNSLLRGFASSHVRSLTCSQFLLVSPVPRLHTSSFHILWHCLPFHSLAGSLVSAFFLFAWLFIPLRVIACSSVHPCLFAYMGMFTLFVSFCIFHPFSDSPLCGVCIGSLVSSPTVLDL